MNPPCEHTARIEQVTRTICTSCGSYLAPSVVPLTMDKHWDDVQRILVTLTDKGEVIAPVRLHKI